MAEALVKGFALPVDSEHKAIKLKIFSFAAPHMRAFHLNWLAFCSTFVATFGPAAMIPIVRDALNLDKDDITTSGIAAVTAAIGARVVMGSLCDSVGPRISMGMTLLLASAPVFGMALANSRIDFTMCRFGIGFSLAAFVCCQYWTSSMFNVKIVGKANAIAAGWGNLGGGATQLLLPAVYAGIASSVAPFVAWRYTFYVPGCMLVIAGAVILLFTQDLPDGNFAMLQKSGTRKADKGWKVLLNAITNYRMFVLMLLYATSFGVELTIYNILTSYYYDQFDLSFTTAGALAACFGLCNVVARATGGISSDFFARRYGMRGRLWLLFSVLSLGGVFCICMALSKDSLPATIVLMLVFAFCVEASNGAQFAIVPFVSKRSLGVVSGVVGAGGNIGSVIVQLAFFTKESIPTYTGILYTGIFILCGSSLVALLYFPMWGSMFTKAREGATEEDYYLGEYTAEERAAGLADAAMKFANESRSQRGVRAGLEAATGDKSTKSAPSPNEASSPREP